MKIVKFPRNKCIASEELQAKQMEQYLKMQKFQQQVISTKRSNSLNCSDINNSFKQFNTKTQQLVLIELLNKQLSQQQGDSNEQTKIKILKKSQNSCSMDKKTFIDLSKSSKQQKQGFKRLKFSKNHNYLKNKNQTKYKTLQTQLNNQSPKLVQHQNYIDKEWCDELISQSKKDIITNLKVRLNNQQAYAFKIKCLKFTRLVNDIHKGLIAHSFKLLKGLNEQKAERQKHAHNIVFTTNVTRINLDTNHDQLWDELQTEAFHGIHRFEQKIQRMVQILNFQNSEFLHFAIGQLCSYSKLSKTNNFMAILQGFIKRQLQEAAFMQMYTKYQTERKIEKMSLIIIKYAHHSGFYSMQEYYKQLIDQPIIEEKIEVIVTKPIIAEEKEKQEERKYYAFSLLMNIEDGKEYDIQAKVLREEKKSSIYLEAKQSSNMHLLVKTLKTGDQKERLLIPQCKQAIEQSLVIEQELVRYKVVYEQSIYEWSRKGKVNELYGVMSIIVLQNSQKQVKGLLKVCNERRRENEGRVVKYALVPVKCEGSRLKLDEQLVRETKRKLCALFFKDGGNSENKSQCSESRSLMKVARMERKAFRFFRTAPPELDCAPLEKHFLLKKLVQEMKSKLTTYCRQTVSAKVIQKQARRYLANIGVSKGKIILRKEFKYNDRPFPINFYYHKKAFKVYVSCEGIGERVVMRPSCFNINRYLTGIENIRTELELQTKYICLDEDWEGVVHISLFDYTLPCGWELIEAEIL